MICNETEGGWEIIFQRAHAFLAAALLAPLRPARRPAPWQRVLLATAQHDHGWQEWEPKGRLTCDGTPRPFTDVRLEDIATQSRSLLQRMWHQDRWVALLVARHLDHLYGPRRGADDALDAFLDEQTRWRGAWRQELSVSQEEEDRAYAPLRWADAFSLALCCRQLEDGPVSLGPGPDGEEDSRTAQVESGTGRRVVTVQPWPYQAEHFAVAVDAYCLEQRTFESHDALLEALTTTEATRRSYVVEAP